MTDNRLAIVCVGSLIAKPILFSPGSIARIRILSNHETLIRNGKNGKKFNQPGCSVINAGIRNLILPGENFHGFPG